jgi:hypothetical protein
MLSETLLRRMFRIAAVYNVCWGTAMVLFPNLLFDLFGLPHINYPFVMSCLGCASGLYGYGYGYWVVAGELRATTAWRSSESISLDSPVI